MPGEARSTWNRDDERRGAPVREEGAHGTGPLRRWRVPREPVPWAAAPGASPRCGEGPEERKRVPRGTLLERMRAEASGRDAERVPGATGARAVPEWGIPAGHVSRRRESEGQSTRCGEPGGRGSTWNICPRGGEGEMVLAPCPRSPWTGSEAPWTFLLPGGRGGLRNPSLSERGMFHVEPTGSGGPESTSRSWPEGDREGPFWPGDVPRGTCCPGRAHGSWSDGRLEGLGEDVPRGTADPRQVGKGRAFGLGPWGRQGGVQGQGGSTWNRRGLRWAPESTASSWPEGARKKPFGRGCSTWNALPGAGTGRHPVWSDGRQEILREDVPRGTTAQARGWALEVEEKSFRPGMFHVEQAGAEDCPGRRVRCPVPTGTREAFQAGDVPRETRCLGGLRAPALA